jgi:hypothetical protein
MDAYAATRGFSMTRKVSRSGYTRKILEDISTEVYQAAIENGGIKILKTCIRRLQNTTFYYLDKNSEERLALDYIGLSAPDVTVSSRILNTLTRWRADGGELKRAILFVYRYREQLRGYGFDIPKCVFDAGN